MRENPPHAGGHRLRIRRRAGFPTGTSARIRARSVDSGHRTNEALGQRRRTGNG